MEVSLAIPRNRQVIESYGAHQFRISGERYEGSVLVFPQYSQSWAVTSFDEVTADTLSPVSASGEVEVLLIGCGKRMAMISKDLRREMRQQGVALEAMDTGAACRTYNVLLSEGRAVAAALISVE